MPPFSSTFFIPLYSPTCSSFFLIFYCNHFLLSCQVSLLSNEMPPEIVNPLRMKYIMYCVFLVLVLISAGMEVRASVLTLSLYLSLSHSLTHTHSHSLTHTHTHSISLAPTLSLSTLSVSLTLSLSLSLIFFNYNWYRNFFISAQSELI